MIKIINREAINLLAKLRKPNYPICARKSQFQAHSDKDIYWTLFEIEQNWNKSLIDFSQDFLEPAMLAIALAMPENLQSTSFSQNLEIPAECCCCQRRYLETLPATSDYRLDTGPTCTRS